MTEAEQREAIRRRLRQWRGQLDETVRAGDSARIVELIAALPQWSSAGTVMLYHPFRGEVDVTALRQMADASGKTVLYPRCIRQQCGIVPHAVAPRDRLTPGAYGIMEPDPHAHPAADPAAIDVLVVPGLAFDDRGYRIGYGAGYYDRFIPRLRPGALTIMAAYAGQQVPRIPERDGEKPVGIIVTEKGIFGPYQ